MSTNSVGVRVQGLALRDQSLSLGRLAQMRSDAGTFSAAELRELFGEMTLPAPSHLPGTLRDLKERGFVRRTGVRGEWQLTPNGRQRAESLITDLDLAALSAEASVAGGPELGQLLHTVVPPALAPPGLLLALHEFLEAHPFDTNVFGMTRFPDEEMDRNDPVAPCLELAATVCATHGLDFHLASDRALDDDLWTNVAGHMWASRYGIAFFEDRQEQGLNYNLTIEVGAMLMSGRRCALLKDRSIRSMPTDLVGRIYHPVDLDDLNSVADALHSWLRDDLRLGACPDC